LRHSLFQGENDCCAFRHRAGAHGCRRVRGLGPGASAGQKPCAEPGDPSKTLSDKLDQGSGVICPPDVDPGIKTPAPDTGKMPVIPPPGSPGGDPKVQPK
jgi:hypothetical protein